MYQSFCHTQGIKTKTNPTPWAANFIKISRIWDVQGITVLRTGNLFKFIFLVWKHIARCIYACFRFRWQNYCFQWKKDTYRWFFYQNFEEYKILCCFLKLMQHIGQWVDVVLFHTLLNKGVLLGVWSTSACVYRVMVNCSFNRCMLWIFSYLWAWNFSLFMNHHKGPELQMFANEQKKLKWWEIYFFVLHTAFKLGCLQNILLENLWKILDFNNRFI